MFDKHFVCSSRGCLRKCCINGGHEESSLAMNREALKVWEFIMTRPVNYILQKQTMLVDHFHFIQEDCKHALTNDRWNDLKFLYSLLKPFEIQRNTFVQEFEQHLKEVLFSELTDGRESAIKAIAEFHHKYSSIIHHTFQSDMHLTAAMDRVCTHVVTRRRALVMTSFNALMKKGLSDTDIKQVLFAFSNIHEGKDILSSLYHKALAKRLLKGTSVSADVERMAVRKLTEYGYQTKKMHMMLNDFCNSQNLTVEFQTSHPHSNNCLDNLFVHVLNPFAWPLQHTLPLESSQMPSFSPVFPNMASWLHLFGKFYLEKYYDRTCTWHPEASSAEIHLTYLNRPYVAVIESFFMPTVLLLFEDHDSLSFAKIEECMDLPGQELLRHLQTLVDSRLLLLDHPGKVHIKSTISLNMMFANKCKTFRVKSTPRKKAVQDAGFTEQNVEQQRKFCIQASIVRIMKAQKVLQHDTLVQQVIQQCSSRFVPNIPMIKMCIEKLIFKEYMERAEDSTEKYRYIP